MSLFKNQLKQREEADNDLFEESFFDVVDSVVGSRSAQDLSDSRIVAKNDIDDYYYSIGGAVMVGETV